MFGDVHLCRFPFTDGQASKPRPVLVLFDLGTDAVVCRVTGKPAAGDLDIALQGWAEAGLLKPSVARLDRILTVDRGVLFRHLGRLGVQDLDKIRGGMESVDAVVRRGNLNRGSSYSKISAISASQR